MVTETAPAYESSMTILARPPTATSALGRQQPLPRQVVLGKVWHLDFESVSEVEYMDGLQAMMEAWADYLHSAEVGA